MLELIKTLPQHGVSIILISHQLDYVIDVANRAIVLRPGPVVGEQFPAPKPTNAFVSLIIGGADATPASEKSDSPT